MNDRLDVLILDGYVDEPSLLGVPPFISPEPRLLAGVAEEKALTWKYVTADEYRKNGLPRSDITLVHGGVTVPGKYLSGTPLSKREAEEIARGRENTFLGGPLAKYSDVKGYDHYSKYDLSAYLADWLDGEAEDRWAALEERERWMKSGAVVVKEHPMFPDPLLAEITTYRGCPRYFTGGCSFCSEPDYGKPVFREQEDIIEEIGRLYDLGIRHFRLGGQSCIFSYKAEGIGETETPKPRPDELLDLFKGINNRCPAIKVLHVDNANPAVIAEHPEESEEILNILFEYTTSGNVLALGMESADPGVIEKNNLNSTPEIVKEAIEMINEAGKERGENGMPELLPGINLLAGLPGETPESYEMNFKFLRDIRDSELLLRRINIRQVISPSGKINTEFNKEFREFKKKVREDIDRPLLEKMLPTGTVLKDIYMEKHDGKITFGRQIGTYPLLVGIEYELPLSEYHDVMITDHGYRSVTGIHHPFVLKEASYKQLQAVPGIGKKRAAKLFREQPKTEEEFLSLFEEEDKGEEILNYITLE